MLSIDELMKEALYLSNTQRAFLAEKLVESLEFDIDEKTQKAWISEAKKRRYEIYNGNVSPIPGEETLAEVRKILEQ
ncbi:MAG: addiction module protein [Okeania sp. SIO2C9]|uniref:addiction module protein n=1 Tax=Okeania sp. SIO2C9 TaxID=2607791 RepID=UPI0013C09E4B|nr:addiction module protein [Okeania sp. SIO2C9]NEQ73404.1 addiction module protein [Okeania sp. SIO2C9]